MKVTIRGKGDVSLTQQHFVATGGQASVYVRDGLAFKIYTDPKDTIPDAKFRALAAIQDPNVVKPTDVLIDPKSHQPIGYTMTAVPEAYSLCQFFTRAFRDRVGVSQGQIVDLASRLRAHVANVHGAGIAIVDLNELNILVPQSFGDTFLIDVDSYQTPGYPATVIMPSVRDYSVHAKDFGPLSDWFSYGVLAFQLFVGGHPYKGTHAGSASLPKDQQLEHRMRGRISAFRKDVRLPKCCYPLDVIPQAFRDWLRAVLDEGKRLAPPDPLGGPAPAFSAAPTPFHVASGKLSVTELQDLDGWQFVDWAESGGHTLLLVSNGRETRAIHDGRTIWSGSTPAGQVKIGFTPKLCRPVALQLDPTGLTFCDFERKTAELLPIRADEIATSGGRFYVRNGSMVLEVEFGELPDRTLVMASHAVADVLPMASHLYEGCAIQSMLGSVFVSLFPRSKAGYQVRIPDLDRYRIVDAKFDGGVLMVVGAKSGKYDRLVFRFDDLFASYDLRCVDDITPSGLNFVTLGNGTCVCLTEDEKIEAFSSRKDSQNMKTVDDPVLGNDMRLMVVGGRVGFQRAGKIYQMSMR